MKRIILFIALTGGISSIFGEDQPVPAWAAPALGLPSAPLAVSGSSVRTEIERLWADGQKPLARKKLDAWMKNESLSPWPWVVSSKWQFEQKQFKKSLSTAQTALKKSPDCGEAYFWRGKAFEAMKKPLDSANEYRAAVMAKDRFSGAQVELDRIQLELGAQSTVASPTAP